MTIKQDLKYYQAKSSRLEAEVIRLQKLVREFEELTTKLRTEFKGLEDLVRRYALK